MYSTSQGITTLIIGVIALVSMWVLFVKAGEKGWKAIIPVYNSYIAYKLFWKKSMFWVALIMSFLVFGITIGEYAAHMDDMVNIFYTAANDMGISTEDLMDENLNMTEEEIQQAARDYTNRLDYELENGEDNPVIDAFADAIKNVTPLDILLMLLVAILSIALFVIGIMYCYNVSKSFGHGAGYTLGLIFLSPIFLLILAFGKSQYVGHGGASAAEAE